MNDAEYSDLQLRATIAPQQTQWPAPELVHWQRLHAAVDEARELVGLTFKSIAEIERDRDLSPEGKKRQRSRFAAQALAELQKSRTLAKAREAVSRVVATWDAKVGAVVKKPADIAEATVHAQIRDRLAVMRNKTSFLEQNGGDPIVASAILTAPAFLSGLSETELSLVKHKVEQHVAPEIAEAKRMTENALDQAERGWQRAQDAIAQRGGLVKSSSGHWHTNEEEAARNKS
jgi:hypothetical protein